MGLERLLASDAKVVIIKRKADKVNVRHVPRGIRVQMLQKHRIRVRQVVIKVQLDKQRAMSVKLVTIKWKAGKVNARHVPWDIHV